MAVRIEDLPPWAQAQAQRKMAEQRRPKAPPSSPATPPAWAGGGKKYHNVRTQRTLEGGGTVDFDSKKEARRYDELVAMLQADPGAETAAPVYHPGGLHHAGGPESAGDPVPGGLLL